MDKQLSLFHEEHTQNGDIRTERQKNKKISYDVGEKIGGARKDE
ncbi:hypothetical protein [Bacillus swezeyi]|nr:hypothetical protein [Bacillus swezeyi]